MRLEMNTERMRGASLWKLLLRTVCSTGNLGIMGDDPPSEFPFDGLGVSGNICGRREGDGARK